MKKIVIVAALLASFGVANAQKSAIRNAKAELGNKAYNKAREAIKPALSNAETANDPDTWRLAFDIESAVGDNQQVLQMTGKNINEEAWYTAIMKSIDYAKKADSLAQIPNNKGRIRNKHRKDIASQLRANHSLFINGGIFYNEKRDYAKASQFFETYTTLPELDLFEGKFEGLNDTLVQQIKFYAAITAIQSGDKDRSIRLLKKIISEPYTPYQDGKESDAYELLAAQYLEVGDSTNYMQVLEQGATKFPENQYFIPNLINSYISQGKAPQAIQYIDQALESDPSNKCQYLSVKASIYGEQQQYENSDKVYLEALETDPNCERALEGLGTSYIVQAQEYKEKMPRGINRAEQAKHDQQLKELYAKSLPLLLKYKELLDARGAEKRELRNALVKLQNAYYNLSLLGEDYSKELDQIEKDLE